MIATLFDVSWFKAMAHSQQLIKYFAMHTHTHTHTHTHKPGGQRTVKINSIFIR